MSKILNNEIHLWYTFDSDIRHLPIMNTYTSWLSAEEIIRLNNYKIKNRKRQFLVTRALVRSVLSIYDPKIMPNEWKFDINEYGKPRISNIVATSLKINFNVSHAHNICIIAISEKKQIGVDCEYLFNKSLDLNLCKLFLTVEEFNQINSILKIDQYSSFLKIWTLKEAFLKGIGVGLILPLNQISLASYHKICIHDLNISTSSPKHWELMKFESIKNYIISIAIECSEYPKKSYKIIAKEIIPSLPSLQSTSHEEKPKLSDYIIQLK